MKWRRQAPEGQGELEDATQMVVVEDEDGYEDEDDAPEQSDFGADVKERLVRDSLYEDEYGEEDSPFSPETQAEEWLQKQILTQKFIKSVETAIDQTHWDNETKAITSMLADQQREQDLVLANLTPEKQLEFRYDYQLGLMLAEMLFPVDDTQDGNFGVISQALSTHVILPASRSSGPERERKMMASKYRHNSAEYRDGKMERDKPRGVIEKYLGVGR
jgi:hypothetical protein